MLPAPARERLLGSLTDDQARALRFAWWFWGRPKQFAPTDDDWLIWLIMAGRGFGKTRCGGEWIVQRAWEGNKDRWIALIGQTPGDVRKYQIEEGPSAILKISPPWFMPAYYPAKGGGRVVWPNGSHASIYSAEKPDKIRGFSGDTAWLDEFAKFRNPGAVLDNLLFGMREEKVSAPRMCITTTPRPLPLLVELSDQTKWPEVRVVTGSSYENTENLSRGYKQILKHYENTDLGEQEIEGRILTETRGALWKRKWIDDNRDRMATDFEKVMVAVDPPGSSKKGSAEAGIIVGGLKHLAGVPHLYVLADLSLLGTPKEWGTAAVDAYHTWKGDAIVGEINYGGEMVEHTIRTVEGGKSVPFLYANATRGKAVRAQPVSALYQRGCGHHVGLFGGLELELCTWEPRAQPPMPSPNRLDALVWVAHALGIGGYEAITDIETPVLRRGG